MKRTTLVSVVALAVLTTLAIIVVLGVNRAASSRAAMPVYQGRTARDWLDQVFTTNQTAAFAAFRAMGTNALPTAVETLNDSTMKRLYDKFYSILPGAIAKHFTPPVSQNTWSAAELLLLNNPDFGTAFPGLVRLLADKHNRARIYIISGICNWTKPEHRQFTPVFSDCLKDPDWTIRDCAAAALGGIGPGARAAIPDLTAALQDTNSAVRMHAAVALWKIDSTSPAAYAALKSDAAATGGWAVIYLCQMNQYDPATMPMLLNLLKGTDRNLRLSAARILNTRGPKAKEAVPVLLELLPKLKRSDPELEFQLFQALRSIDPDAATKYHEEE